MRQWVIIIDEGRAESATRYAPAQPRAIAAEGLGGADIAQPGVLLLFLTVSRG